MASIVLKRYRKSEVEVTAIDPSVTLTVNSENLLTALGNTTTPLGGGIAYNGAAHAQATGGYKYVVGICKADQAGTIAVQFSYDGGATWDGETAKSYTANDPLNFIVPINAPHFRMRFVNGGVAQTSFALYWYGGIK